MSLSKIKKRGSAGPNLKRSRSAPVLSQTSQKLKRRASAPSLSAAKALKKRKAVAGDMAAQVKKKIKRKKSADAGPPTLTRQRAVSMGTGAGPPATRGRALSVRTDAGSDNSQTTVLVANPGRKIIGDGKPKVDRKRGGRLLYPALGADGKPTYLPKRSEATDSERDSGLFVKDTLSNKEAIRGVKHKIDRKRGRRIYPTNETDKNGKRIYLPRKSEATPYERAKGLYVQDEPGKEDGDGKRKPDRKRGRRYLYPTKDKDEDGNFIYLPKKSQATPTEIAEGLYVKDTPSNRKIAKKDKDGNPLDRKKDPVLNRYTYPSINKDGRTDYLPRKKDATPEERANGKYIREERTIAEGFDTRKDAEGRTLYPSENEDGIIDFLPRENDATDEEKEEGSFVENTENIRTVRKDLKPKVEEITDKDGNKSKRNVYPSENENGVVEYVPREDDATDEEIEEGKFIKNNKSFGMPLTVEPFKSKTETMKRYERGESKYKIMSYLRGKLYLKKRKRMLYPVKVLSDEPGEKFTIVYYPSKSAATDSEKDQGHYIEDDEAIELSELERRRKENAEKRQAKWTGL